MKLGPLWFEGHGKLSLETEQVFWIKGKHFNLSQWSESLYVNGSEILNRTSACEKKKCFQAETLYLRRIQTIHTPCSQPEHWCSGVFFNTLRESHMQLLSVGVCACGMGILKVRGRCNASDALCVFLASWWKWRGHTSAELLLASFKPVQMD